MKNKELSTLDKEIIFALAECDMRPFRVPQKIYVSKGTVAYHIKKIKEKTGLDAKKFYDLCQLLEIVNTQQA